MFAARHVGSDVGCIKNRKSSFACYRTTSLIHTGYAYSERALTETGTDQDWLAIPWSKAGERRLIVEPTTLPSERT